MVLVSVLILAGCGGGGTSRTVDPDGTGRGVPLRGAGGLDGDAAHGRRRGGLGRPSTGSRCGRSGSSRPYDVRRFHAAARELDSVISRLATQLDGKVTSRRTVRVGGRKSRSYTIAYDGKTQQITFVLQGRQEHQLLCRRGAGGDAEPCRALLATFVLR